MNELSVFPQIGWNMLVRSGNVSAVHAYLPSVKDAFSAAGLHAEAKVLSIYHSGVKSYHTVACAACAVIPSSKKAVCTFGLLLPWELSWRISSCQTP